MTRRCSTEPSRRVVQWIASVDFCRALLAGGFPHTTRARRLKQTESRIEKSEAMVPGCSSSQAVSSRQLAWFVTVVHSWTMGLGELGPIFV